MTGKAANHSGRDVRLDLFRGLANWAIFLDHIPNNAVAWITMKHYGFSDAADLFVFVSGYTVAYVYSRTMAAKGFLVAAIGILARAWQIYVAHILLFVFYVVAIGYLAQRYGHAHLLDEFNIRRLIADPIEFLKHGLLLEFKPLNMDVLPLYIALMATFPPVLWLLVRSPNLTLAASCATYVAALARGWNLPSYPEGVWYFNPFAWQFLFVIGAWVALDRTDAVGRLVRSRAALWAAAVFLALALVVVLTTRLGLAAAMPAVLVDVFIPNDKTNLAPYRILHFLA
ncbi:OpgC family protein, partial [Bradyrhizobium sp.]